MALVATSLFSGRIAETLYGEALLLAAETRAYFDGPGRVELATLPPKARAEFAGEALKATIRVTQIISWLTMRRMSGTSAQHHQGLPVQLGQSGPSDSRVLGGMPTAARQIILTGIELHARIGRLASGVEAPINAASPARGVSQRWERAF